ncbi:MAG: hypothetical protein IJ509_03835 [Bacilli bacterium]|nr:hypothetical protein [Bacilli bacterium]
MRLLVRRLFCCFILSTVVLYFLAIAYRVSPEVTVWIVFVVGISIISVVGSCNT